MQITGEVCLVVPVITLSNHISTETVFTKRHDVDIVVLSGSPGAGKSTFFWTWLAPLGYHRINQDILKTVSSFPCCF